MTTETRHILENAAAHAIAFREGVDTRPARPTAKASVLEMLLGGDTPEKGEDPTTIINELVDITKDGLMAVPGGRFFGWVMGASHPAGVAADWLVSAWGQNAGNFHASPAAAMAEKVAGDWLLDILQLPKTASVGFVTGATMASFTCLAAARSEVLARVGWNLEKQGFQGAPKITVLLGADAHSTIFNGLQYLGFGRDAIVQIATDDQGRMMADELKEHLETINGPKIVIAQAGQINTGAFDPFDEIVPACRASGAWLHIDGAFGLWANSCKNRPHYMNGIDKADSWATDGHKWLQVPYDSGFAIVAHPKAHARVMSINASYLPTISSGQHESTAYVPELSRRARGFAAWAIIRAMGREGICTMVKKHCSMAANVAARLGEVEGITVENEVTLNQIILSFGDDESTDAVIKAIQMRNRVFLEGAEWRGKRVARISIISEPTTEDDIELLETEISKAWAMVQVEREVRHVKKSEEAA